MWRNYLKNPNDLSHDPFNLQEQLKKQFDRLTPKERWTALSLIENNSLLIIKKQSYNNSHEEFKEEFDEFEDTIYNCVQCGSKKIDVYQKQLRSAVSGSNIYVFYDFCLFSLCFISTG